MPHCLSAPGNLTSCHRFFSNASGAHVYGRPIFDGEGGQGDVAAAWASVSAGGGFSGNKFAARGGVYDWGQGRDSLAAQMEHWGPGASVAAGQRQA